jgi:hypothetical protein
LSFYRKKVKDEQRTGKYEYRLIKYILFCHNEVPEGFQNQYLSSKLHNLIVLIAILKTDRGLGNRIRYFCVLNKSIRFKNIVWNTVSVI